MATSTVRRSDYSGFDLKLARIIARISQTELAREVGVARPLVAAWEASTRPSEAAVQRYLEALRRILDQGGAR